MSDASLPELPESGGFFLSLSNLEEGTRIHIRNPLGSGYTADQMREYALAERKRCAERIRKASAEAYDAVLEEHEEAARWLEERT